MDWQTLYNVCNILTFKHKPLRSRLNLEAVKIKDLHAGFVLPTAGYNPWRNFTLVLHRARSKRATDPRDHVFALLGHFSAPMRAPGIPLLTADYNKSELQVFHEVAVRMIKSAKDLELLQAVQHDCYDLRGQFVS